MNTPRWCDHPSEEQALRDQIAELEIANRILVDFGALLSHDLVSSLRTVVSFAELLRDTPSVNSDPHTLCFLNTILSSSQTIRTCINERLAEHRQSLSKATS
jgi:light-regulated signal transduction histidine kinase (bacteriophytochrome)